MKIKLSGLKSAFIGIISFGACFESDFLLNKIKLFDFIGTLCWIVMLLYLILNITWRYIKKESLSIVSQCTIIFIFAILGSTIIREGNLNASILALGKILIITLTLEYVKYNEKNFIILLKTWMYLLLTVIFIDLMTELLFPNGLYKGRIYELNWFLGYKTERAIYSLPLAGIALYLEYLEKKRVTVLWYLLMVIIFFNAWLSQAMSVCVAYGVLLGGICGINIFCKRKGRILKKFISIILNYKFFLLTFFVFMISIVFLENITIMKYIARFTGRSVTFSSRTFIWQACIARILDNPLIGLGYMGSSDYIAITGMRAGTNAHNIVLTLLMTGGFFLLGIYLLIYFLALKNRYELTRCQQVGS